MLISRNYDENHVPYSIIILNTRAIKYDTGEADPLFLAMFWE